MTRSVAALAAPRSADYTGAGMAKNELEKLLADIRRVRIAVIGDYCLDAYWTLDASLSEISIETGLATRPVRSQRYSLGGAGNVVNNLLSLGVSHVRAYGVLGADPFGREMLRILDAASVDTRGLFVQQKRWDTPVYIKPVEGEAEQARIDFGNANELDPATGTALCAALAAAVPDVDMVVANQQLEHGINTEEVRRTLAGLIAGGRVPFICDSRSFSDSYAGAVRKLNDREALRLCDVQWESDEPVPRPDAERAAETLFGRWKTPVFLTRGARGMLVRDAEACTRCRACRSWAGSTPWAPGTAPLPGSRQRSPPAAGALKPRPSATWSRASPCRNCSSPERQARRKSSPWGPTPTTSFTPSSPRMPAAHATTATRRSRSSARCRPRRRVTHAIFDNDGTISTLREGWETIMEPVMIRAILGDGWKTAEEKLFLRCRTGCANTSTRPPACRHSYRCRAWWKW